MRFGSLIMAMVLGLSASIGSAQTPLTTVRVATGLSRPVYAASPPGDQDRLFIIEQHTGRIKILNLGTGVVNATPFLDINGLATGNEQGLLGLAFHPDYANNGNFYVYVTIGGSTIVRRYTVSAGDPDIADPASVQTVIRYTQPFSNHNGGWIGFGPDGYLYIASGDGGAGGDPGNRAQDITNQKLGKILRLDVDVAGGGYNIPPSNPFVGITGDDEIWSYGLRNPWRASFDRLTGDFYLGDVGQNAFEEIDFQPGNSPGGENYGWRCYEGNQPFNTAGCPPMGSLVFPIHVYSLAGSACAVTGGYVYRGCAVPDLQGTYFFADYCSRRIWSFRYDAVAGTVNEFTDRTIELTPTGASIRTISSFGEDANGEIYICDMSGGEVFKIVPDGVPPVACTCYADCDQSTGVGVLDVFDFLCFQNSFVNAEPYACDCDTSTGPGVCDVFDFLCFQDAFVAGCP